MRIWMLGLLTVIVATSGVAQEIDEVAPMEGGAMSLLARSPGTRAAPDVAADFVQLPAAVALAPGAGFNVAGYVAAAPPDLLVDAQWQTEADGRFVYAVEFEELHGAVGCLEGVRVQRRHFDAQLQFPILGQVVGLR